MLGHHPVLSDYLASGNKRSLEARVRKYKILIAYHLNTRKTELMSFVKSLVKKEKCVIEIRKFRGTNKIDS